MPIVWELSFRERQAGAIQYYSYELMPVIRSDNNSALASWLVTVVDKVVVMEQQQLNAATCDDKYVPLSNLLSEFTTIHQFPI